MSVATEAPPNAVAAPVSTTAAVVVQDLHKQFAVRRGWLQMLRRPFGGGFATALQGVSLEVRQGEFFGLLGPNGAGKTTLFKILSTLILPDSGRVQVGGHDVEREAAAVRRVLVPVIPEERSLNWRLSARENLRVFAALYGLRGGALERRVEEVLDQVELADTGQKLVAQFSSGMRQRLLIARALLPHPRILLLDEPTRALDPVSAYRFRRFLREQLVERQGCTVLLATHNTEEALELCDRVGVLHRGRLLTVGAPADLQERFRDEDYRFWVRAPDWERFQRLLRLGRSIEPTRIAEGEEWEVAQVHVPGGADEVSSLLAELVRGGVRISRVEAVQLSVADLIERVIRRSEEGANV